MHPQVQATLDRAGTFYRVLHHSDWAAEISTPVEFAGVLGYEPERICKTLLLRGPEPGVHALAVCSANRVMNLSSVSALLGWGGVRVATKADLEGRIGYPPGSVTPLGIEGLPVLIDAAVIVYETVLIGAGQAGVEVELTPRDLVSLTGAVVAPIVAKRPNQCCYSPEDTHE